MTFEMQIKGFIQHHNIDYKYRNEIYIISHSSQLNKQWVIDYNIEFTTFVFHVKSMFSSPAQNRFVYMNYYNLVIRHKTNNI